MTVSKSNLTLALSLDFETGPEGPVSSHLFPEDHTFFLVELLYNNILKPTDDRCE